MTDEDAQNGSGALGTTIGRRPVTLLLGVDCEPDNVWADFRSTGLRNISGLPRFHDYVSALGIRPTYLLTHSFASDPVAVRVLRRLQDAGGEVGAHLHAWEVAPFLPSGIDRDHQVLGQDLPVDHFQAKLRVLTERLIQEFGRPRSYRAGRYGFSREHIPVLESLGYTIDSSVTPLIDRRGKFGVPEKMGGRGGRDYRLAPLDPYYPGYGDDLKPGACRLLEVPLTAGTLRPVSPLMMAVHRRGPYLSQRVLRKLKISSVVVASLPEITWDHLRRLLETAVASGRTVINCMLHSSETIVGASPNVKTADEHRALFDRVRAMVHLLRERSDLRFATLGEYSASFGTNPLALPPSRIA